MTTIDDDSMGLEFYTLDDETKQEVRNLVAKVWGTRLAEAYTFRGGDIYAYPNPETGGICWGVNGPVLNIARGDYEPKPKIV